MDLLDAGEEEEGGVHEPDHDLSREDVDRLLSGIYGAALDILINLS